MGVLTAKHFIRAIRIRIGALADTGIIARQVGEVRRILTSSPNHLKRKGTPTCLDDLIEHDIIFTSGIHNNGEWRLYENGHERILHATSRLLVNDRETALSTLQAG